MRRIFGNYIKSPSASGWVNLKPVSSRNISLLVVQTTMTSQFKVPVW